MIVKSGRLYLWKNKISDDELIIKVGTGMGSAEYVEIDQTDLESEITEAQVLVTSEAEYNSWLTDQDLDHWHESITDISETDAYLFENERKIIIYVMISTDVSFELGEMGLFVKKTIAGDPVTYEYIMISRNLIHKQHISTTESKIIKYTINI